MVTSLTFDPTMPPRRRRYVAVGPQGRTATERELELQHEIKRLQFIAQDIVAIAESADRGIARICRVVDAMLNPALTVAPLREDDDDDALHRDFVIEHFNRAAAESSGWSEDQLRGRRLSRVYLADVCRGVAAAYSACPRSDEMFAWRGHPWVVDETGRMRRVEANLCALRVGDRLLLTWPTPTEDPRSSTTDFPVRFGRRPARFPG